MDRPDFLNQLAQQRDRDRDEQEYLRKQAEARNVIPSRGERQKDFVERSIAEVERHLIDCDDDTRADLEKRLEFLKEERARGQ